MLQKHMVAPEAEQDAVQVPVPEMQAPGSVHAPVQDWVRVPAPEWVTAQG